MSRRRVVVTGMGILCPTGNTVETAWENIAAGKSGIGPITLFDPSELGTRIAGEVKDFNPELALSSKEVRRTDRVTQFAVEVTRQAMEDSGLVITEELSHRIGCIIGSGIGGIQSLIETVQTIMEKGYRSVSPLSIPRILIDSSAGKVSIEFNLRGPNLNITTACATGNDCIGEAAAMIRNGNVDLMVAGATEAAIVDLTIAGFGNMKALTNRNDEPERASRPFDKERDGFVPAEGAGVLILEELEHAKARGAHIYGEILGFGHTSDAYHSTAPREDGDGALRSMQQALQDADLNIDQIDYINAHGTSTSLNDRSESYAVKRLFGDRAYEIPMSSTKSMTGHMLGASGAVEAIFCLKAIADQFLPPTINLETPDPDCDLNYIPNQGIKKSVETVMSNAFGFGGHNSTLIIGKYVD